MRFLGLANGGAPVRRRYKFAVCQLISERKLGRPLIVDARQPERNFKQARPLPALGDAPKMIELVAQFAADVEADPRLKDGRSSRWRSKAEMLSI